MLCVMNKIEMYCKDQKKHGHGQGLACCERLIVLTCVGTCTRASWRRVLHVQAGDACHMCKLGTRVTRLQACTVLLLSGVDEVDHHVYVD